MAAALQEQLDSLERKRDEIKDYTIREAVDAQITTLRKKILAKAGRSSVTADGVTVKVGDKVYAPNPPRYDSYNQVLQRGTVHTEVIQGISADGLEYTTSSARAYKTYYHYTKQVYGTVEAALAAIDAKIVSDIEQAKRYLEKDQKDLEKAQALVAFNVANPPVVKL